MGQNNGNGNDPSEENVYEKLQLPVTKRDDSNTAHLYNKAENPRNNGQQVRIALKFK